MKKKYVKIVSVLLSFLLVLNVYYGILPVFAQASAVSTLESKNLIPNGGFENVVSGSGYGWTDWQASGWSVWKAQGTCTITVDNTTYREGSRALKITSTDSTGKWPVMQTGIPVTAGKHYKLSGWIKTKDISNVVFLRAYFTAANVQIKGAVVDFGWLSGTKDWTYVEKEFTAIDGANGIELYNYFSNGTGTAWFDGLKLEETDNLMTNGSFEQVTAGTSGGWTNYKADGWSVWTPEGKAQATVDNVVYKEGSKSLKISSIDGSTRSIVGQYNIPVQQGKYYKLSEWIKTDSLTGGAGVRIQLYDSNNVKVDMMFTDSIMQTKDWTLIEKVFLIPDNASKCYIENYYYLGTGTAWFDGAVLQNIIPVTGMSLDKSEASIIIGETVGLNASIQPADATNKNITWSSSDSQTATVTDGQVTGLKAGAVTITAATAEGNYKDSCIVVVNGQQSDITSTNYTVSTDEDVCVSGTVKAIDSANHKLTYSKLSNPSHGWVQMDGNGNWTYTSNKDYNGTDSFIVLIDDGNGNIAVSNVTVNVNPVNDKPILENISVSTVSNSPLGGKIQGKDIDGDNLSYTKLTDASHGTVTVDSQGNWVYTPSTGYIGLDSFVIQASDGNGGTGDALITVLVAPAGTSIIDTLIEKNPQNQHPRIMANSDDFSRIKSQLDSDPYISAWYKDVKLNADQVLTEDVCKYVFSDGVRLLDVSRKVLDRIQNLAMMYRLTGENKYADRAWLELQTVCGKNPDQANYGFPDWHPAHFLDTAEMTAAVAIGYDWLYDYLTQDQRSIVREGIKTRGLQAALDGYKNKDWWSTATNNWNVVCNGAIGLGALAIADEGAEYEAMAGELLEKAIVNIPNMVTEYAPDGAWMEGPAYWDYANRYLSYITSAMDKALGTDYGLLELPGVSVTAYFPIYTSGPKGNYNFADADTSLIRSPAVLWFANKFNNPEFAWYHANTSEKTGGVMDMVWYRQDLLKSVPSATDKYFRNVEIADLHSDLEDPYGKYIGFKAGDNQAPHGDLDIGSFVFDALGVRWASDLGADNYNMNGYWDMTSNGTRWTYYRKRAEAHNTLVINPDNKPDQDPYTKANIEAYCSKPQGAYAITDMTSAYKEEANSVKRGIALVNNRSQLIVQDEIHVLKPSEIWWFMTTAAEISISGDGKSAILTSNDKRLYVKILSSDNAAFTVMNAEPLPTSPNPSGQGANTDYKKLTIHLNDIIDTTLSVEMVPLMPGDSIPDSTPQIVPLKDWSIPDGTAGSISDIKVDGKSLESFSPGKTVYDVLLPSSTNVIPTVMPVINSYGVTAVVKQAESLPGVAKIEVSSADGIKNTYYVNFKVSPLIGKPTDLPELSVAGVTASDTQIPNIPENTIDKNMDTRWSAEGKEWIQYDLGEAKTVNCLSVAWFKGNERYTTFDIMVSNDGLNWNLVYTGAGTGTTIDPEVYDFSDVTARYVRIKVYGNSLNMWNSLTEVGIYGPAQPITEKNITIGGIEEGQSYTDSIIPSVSVQDTGIGIRNITKQLDGKDWVDGSAVTQKGQHIFTVTVTDGGGNIAVKSVRFSLYNSTVMKVESASGKYSDTIALQAYLTDNAGKPLRNELISFNVNNMLAGSAYTDDNGVAVLRYFIDLGTDSDTTDYDITASFGGDDSAMFSPSTAKGVLTVAKKDAVVNYTGDTVVQAGGTVNLRAQISRQVAEKPGILTELPVQFAIYTVNTDNTLTPYYNSVADEVYKTDDTGSVSAVINLPAGLYSVKVKLLNNSYYNCCESNTIIALFDTKAGAEADGWFDIQESSSEKGSIPKKVHFEVKLSYDQNVIPSGRLRIHAEPQGLDMTMNSTEWIVAAGENVYLQGIARDEKDETYTVRLMLTDSKTDPTVSLLIWKGSSTQETPLFQSLGERLSGNINLTHE